MNYELWEKDTFLNKNVPYAFNKEIVEYDIREAGYNLCKYFELLPPKKIKKLDSLTKERRHVLIGVYQRDDKEFSQQLTQAFALARKAFFIANRLESEDILSIKKDAIFTFKYCKHTIFDNVEFRKKHAYTSYICINRFEFFYNQIEGLTVKNLDKIGVEYHRNYMLKFVESCFYHFENSSHDTLLRYLRKFVDQYKSYDLPLGYYRTLDSNPRYMMKNSDICYDDYYDDKKYEVDNTYNYINFIIPIIKIAY